MKYVVIPTKDLTEAHIEHCDQDSLETTRRSLDGKKAILSYPGSRPPILAQYKELDAKKALKLMRSSAWNANTPSLMKRLKAFFR